MNKIKFYSHVSPIENESNILSEGIKANEDGEIFLFIDGKFKHPLYGIHPEFNKKVVIIHESIALNQVGCNHFTVFDIDVKGIKNELQPDNVAEMTAKWQFILKQELIKPEFIKVAFRRKIEFEEAPILPPIEFDEPVNDPDLIYPELEGSELVMETSAK